MLSTVQLMIKSINIDIYFYNFKIAYLKKKRAVRKYTEYV